MYPRNIQNFAREALGDTPVLLLNGARQTGKSTLAQSLDAGRRYLTLDDPVVLAAAQSDPFGFIDGLDGPVCLDEVQRAPGIFLAMALMPMATMNCCKPAAHPPAWPSAKKAMPPNWHWTAGAPSPQSPIFC